MTDMLGHDALTPLHPNHRKVLAIEALLVAVPILIAAAVSDFTGTLPTGTFLIPAVLIAGWIVIGMPGRRYRAKGYTIGDNRLRVVGGVWFKKDTVVPFGRVQHLDVEQGPLERMFGLATLVMHTAGTHNASISVPGLAHEDAVTMRETIRAHIKRETL